MKLTKAQKEIILGMRNNETMTYRSYPNFNYIFMGRVVSTKTIKAIKELIVSKKINRLQWSVELTELGKTINL